MVQAQPKIYVQEKSTQDQRRNEMQVAIQMLQRTANVDGSFILEKRVIQIAQALLIAGAKDVPSIQMLIQILRKVKCIDENKKLLYIELLESRILRDTEQSMVDTKVKVAKQDSSSESEDDQAQAKPSPARTVLQEVSTKTRFESFEDLERYIQRELSSHSGASQQKEDEDQVWQKNLKRVAEKLTEDQVQAMIQHYCDLKSSQKIQVRASSAIQNAVDPKLHGEIFKSESRSGTNIQGSLAVRDMYVSIFGRKEIAIDGQKRHLLEVVNSFKFVSGDGEDWIRKVNENYETLQLLEVMHGDVTDTPFTKNDLRSSLIRHVQSLDSSQAVIWNSAILEDPDQSDAKWLMHKMVEKQLSILSLQQQTLQGQAGKGKKDSGTANYAQSGQCDYCGKSHYTKNCPKIAELENLAAQARGAKMPDGKTNQRSNSGNQNNSRETTQANSGQKCFYCQVLGKTFAAQIHQMEKCRNRQKYIEAISDPDRKQEIDRKHAEIIKTQRESILSEAQTSARSTQESKDTITQPVANPAMRAANGSGLCQICFSNGRDPVHNFMTCPYMHDAMKSPVQNSEVQALKREALGQESSSANSSEKSTAQMAVKRTPLHEAFQTRPSGNILYYKDDHGTWVFDGPLESGVIDTPQEPESNRIAMTAKVIKTSSTPGWFDPN